eukprot:CAMPEP_0175832894 /NCGR_PEP_ID=MMETSP0107_2-20121207/15225_1 /TAXON_ID=195067 ORGANISM="Goniomonas pacifica, Strain CCMP1869" /NCGR_SAMPLE_ID=MMETSP0107_2 /ASSEMBLY_ACC=CAM_ASM_000203 /LENGTH=30 /DNA_ID= /DNA_START= /DNA_END= /DNA_ORIENTATION=
MEMQTAMAPPLFTGWLDSVVLELHDSPHGE